MPETTKYFVRKYEYIDSEGVTVYSVIVWLLGWFVIKGSITYSKQERDDYYEQKLFMKHLHRVQFVMSREPMVDKIFDNFVTLDEIKQKYPELYPPQ